MDGPGLTLSALAQAKRLPEEKLGTYGLRDAVWREHSDAGQLSVPAVLIPYRDASGALLRERYRCALARSDENDLRFRWGRGAPGLHLYGVWLLEETRKLGWTLLVEGESDCWTAWHHGLPCLGVPGKSAWTTQTGPAWAEQLAGLEVLVWQEPEAEDFVQRIVCDLPEARLIVAPEGVKDLSEAHLQNIDVRSLVGGLRETAPLANEALRCGQGESAAQAEPWQGLAALADRPEPAELEGALRAFKAACGGLDAIARTTATYAACQLLRERHVSSPAECVRSALAGAQEHTVDEAGAEPGDLLRDPEPWPQEVEGEALLDEVHATLRRYVAASEEVYVAASLWVALAHCYQAFYVLPLLGLISPVKRSGKTQLLTVISSLVPRALLAANITPAALFRAIDIYRPTLLVDEADTFLRDKPELNGILNGGHTKVTAFVVRSVGDDHEPRRFTTWCPKVYASIRRQADTLEDRSIVLPMRRRLAGERIEALRLDREGAFAPLRSRLARWAADHSDELRGSDPALPDLGNDRAADNWRPLVAIADAAGGWGERARAAARSLAGQADDEGEERVDLLADLQALFARQEVERLTSAEITQALVVLEDRPWPEWRQGKPLSPAQLAGLLRPFGIAPQVMKREGRAVRGYRRSDFNDAFARYLSPQSVTGVTALQNATKASVTAAFEVTPEKGCLCRQVTAVTPQAPEPEALRLDLDTAQIPTMTAKENR